VFGGTLSWQDCSTSGLLLSSEPVTGSAGVSKKIVKIAEYDLARSKPAAECRDEKCIDPPSPLDALAETPDSGVTKEKHAAELHIRFDDLSEPADWAGRAPILSRCPRS
jgi:hypothetical protein